MKRPNRKVSAVAVLGIAAFVLAGLALKPVILEQWYLWKLESEDEESRKDAAANLAELGAVGAVPVMLKLLGRTTGSSGTYSAANPPEHSVASHRTVMINAARLKLTPSTVTGPIQIDVPSEGIRFDRNALSIWFASSDSIFLLDALWKLTSVVGERSVPYLVTALDDSGWYVPYWSALLLGRLGPQARGAIPALTTALRHESELVRNAAARQIRVQPGEPPRPHYCERRGHEQA